MSEPFDEPLSELIARAKTEDLGQGDVTTSLLENVDQPSVFRLLAKQDGVWAGSAIAEPVLHAYDSAIKLEWTKGVTEGMPITGAPVTLAELRGPLGPLLAAERVLLNFLQRISGVATQTRRFVKVVTGTGAKVYDTRKTVPGWRALDRYAVRCGGGHNHRAGLFDAVLIKNNHLTGVEPNRLAGRVFEMLNRLGADPSGRPSFVEVEARSLTWVGPLLDVVGIDIILLDNFNLEDLDRAVRLRDSLGLRGRVLLEASGGVTLETIRVMAETGVERISVGALTHSAAALNLSLERVG